MQKFRKNQYELIRKITPLGIKLQSIFADLMWINNKFHSDNHSPWLIAANPVNSNFISTLVHYWFTQLAAKEGMDPPPKVHEDKLVWRKINVSEVRNNETRFSLIPAIIANRFSESSKTLIDQTGKSHDLKFSKVFTSNQVECMSQPISRNAGYYSYVIGFRLKTRGGQSNRPLLLVTCGIRRFVTKPVETKYLKGKINSTILVSLAHPFLKQQGKQSHSFAKLSFRRAGKNEATYTRWSQGLDELFWDVLYGKSFSSEEILTNPSDYWNNAKMQALIIHNNQLFKSHSIGPGASKGEKNHLYDLVREELHQLTSLKPLQFIADPVSKRRKKGDTILPLFRASSQYQHIKLEIWGQSDLYEAAKSFLQSNSAKGKAISIEYSNNIFKVNADQNLIIEVIACEDSTFIEPLETDNYGSGAFDQRSQGIFNCKRQTDPTYINKSTREIIFLNETKRRIFL